MVRLSSLLAIVLIGTSTINAHSDPHFEPKHNIWKGLGHEEVTSLLKWIHQPELGFNLTAYDDSGPWDNYVSVVELVLFDVSWTKTFPDKF